MVFWSFLAGVVTFYCSLGPESLLPNIFVSIRPKTKVGPGGTNNRYITFKAYGITLTYELFFLVGQKVQYDWGVFVAVGNDCWAPCKSESIENWGDVFLSQFDCFMTLGSRFNLYCDSDLLQLVRIDYCDFLFPLTDKNIKIVRFKRHIFKNNSHHMALSLWHLFQLHMNGR